MSKRSIVSILLIAVMGLMSLPLSYAQRTTQGSFIKISTYRDDPFVNTAALERIDASGLNRAEDQRPLLINNRVEILDEAVIYREDQTTGEFKPFAWNPWPPQPVSNQNGNFKFQDEARFPLFVIERGPDGKPVLVDGLQVWKPLDIYLGMTTTFKAANDGKDAAEFWSGRVIKWGKIFKGNYQLQINSHSFIDFNAFYAPGAKQLFLGVVPYRLPGETAVKMFETASSWELVAHECGHALHHTLKPNIDFSNQGCRIWAESFGDQIAMWVSLADKDRARTLLEEVSGNLNQSNSLTRLVEAFAALTGEGTSMRDAFHDKKVSDTSEEEHNRSEVLTGAAYKVFTLIFNYLKNSQGLDDRRALSQAGDIMGTFITRTTDFTPENQLTLEDVGKAYLKVDKEIFKGRYHNLFADEFFNREIFDASSVAEWMEHEALIPDLRLPNQASQKKVNKLLQSSLDTLGLGPEFGLKLQSITQDSRFGQVIVRVQLTDGRGEDAPLFDNHGILVFRADGSLADYHSPLPSDDGLQIHVQVQARARAMIEEARRLSIDQRGAPLSIVRKTNGRFGVEARVMRSEGIYCWIEAYTVEHPEGERREVIIPTVSHKIRGVQSSGVQILAADDLNE